MLTNSALTGLDANDAPRLARAEAIEQGASAFFTFARRQENLNGSFRFDLTRKVADAEDFSAESGGSSFALPTKLQGTSKFQPSLAALGAVPHRYRKLVARVVPDTRSGKAGEHRVSLHFGGDRVGYVQDKHLAWLLPMLQTTQTGQVAPSVGVGFYALQVTGGQPGRPTRGLNVVITGAGERAALLLDHYRSEAAVEAMIEEEERHAMYPDF